MRRGDMTAIAQAATPQVAAPRVAAATSAMMTTAAPMAVIRVIATEARRNRVAAFRSWVRDVRMRHADRRRVWGLGEAFTMHPASAEQVGLTPDAPQDRRATAAQEPTQCVAA